MRKFTFRTSLLAVAIVSAASAQSQTQTQTRTQTRQRTVAFPIGSAETKGQTVEIVFDGFDPTKERVKTARFDLTSVYSTNGMLFSLVNARTEAFITVGISNVLHDPFGTGSTGTNGTLFSDVKVDAFDTSSYSAGPASFVAPPLTLPTGALGGLYGGAGSVKVKVDVSAVSSLTSIGSIYGNGSMRALTDVTDQLTAKLTVQTEPVPEPFAFASLGVGLAALARRRAQRTG